jgi:hypothetical protein
MRKSLKIVTIAGCALSLVSLPIAQAVVLYGLPSQYDETYYGELKDLYQKLSTTSGKKVVVLGNSNVAFGVNSALLEKELKAAGLDYTVCNFGLYISLGTKVMLDLSRDWIKKDDIVLFSPEPISQALSLYFSGQEMWYALDSDASLFPKLSSDEKKEVLGSAWNYIGEKWSYVASGKKADSGTIYAHASFDGNGDFTKTPRPNNTMDGLYDPNNLIRYDISQYSSDFLSYVNSYAKEIQAKGATMYYTYCPMNKLAVKDYSYSTVEAFDSALSQSLSFPIISSPYHYLMEANWFFDANVHLNDAGMTYRTLLLAEDLKNELGSTTANVTSIPTMPAVPTKDNTGTGDNTDLDSFTLTEGTEGYTLTGLTENGKTKSDLILPYSYQGKTITGFADTLFSNDTSLVSLTVQPNILRLLNASFTGCTALKTLTLEQTDPEKLAVGYNLLDGTSDVTIRVPQASLSAYMNNYYWGHYAASLKGY